MAQFQATTASSAPVRAAQHQECPECYDPLYIKPVSVLCENSSGTRACGHYLHSECASMKQDKTCAVCQHSFTSVCNLPNPLEDPKQWFSVVDTDGDKQLGYEEILDGLKAQLALDWGKIEADADTLWSKWDADGSMMVSEKEFLDPKNGPIAYLKEHYPRTIEFTPPPDIRHNKAAWFDFWDEDRSELLDKGEVGRALMKTFKVLRVDRSAVLGTLEIVWPIFDVDGSGKVDKNEFIAPDNLADTIIAQILADGR